MFPRILTCIIFLLPTLGRAADIQFTYSLPDSAPITLTYPQDPLTLTDSSFSLSLLFPATVTSADVSLSNALLIQNSATFYLSSPSPNTDISLTFTGPISLAGSLSLQSDYGPDYFHPSSASILLTGTITLDQSSTHPLALSSSLGYDPGYQQTTIAGNILDDPNASHIAAQPLHLSASYDSPSTLTISGTANTYSTGTIIDMGTIVVAPNSSLGTGDVTVQDGTLVLNSPSNLAPGRTALIQYGALSLRFDQTPYTLINPASFGTLDLDTDFSTLLDMSKLGNGQMSLASSASGTYSAPSLLPAADHIYRFSPAGGTPSSLLTLSHSVLSDYNGIPSSAQLASVILAAPNSYSGGTSILGPVYANASGALGTGNVTIGDPQYNDPKNGQLYLSAPNTYAPSAHVEVYGTLAAIGTNGSIPFSTSAPVLHPESALVLGDGLTSNPDRYPDTMPINLNNSNLVLNGIGSTTETVGPISFSGISNIVLNNPALGDNSITLHAPSLTPQSPHSVVFIIPYALQGLRTDYLNPLMNFNPQDPNNGNLLLDVAPTVTNGMVAPYFQARPYWYAGQNFLDYGPMTSFLTYTAYGFDRVNYVPMPTNGGTGTEVVSTATPDSYSGPPVTLPRDTSIYALSTDRSINNPDSGPVTIRIISGGLITLFGGTIQPNVDFASAEAFINTDLDQSTTEIAGSVSAPQGLTKFGAGSLLLSNPINQIPGPITILEGSLSLAALPNPTSPQPITLSASGSLYFTSAVTLSRPLIINAGSLLSGVGSGVSAAGPLSITAPISGDGSLTLDAPSITISAPISVSHFYTGASNINFQSTFTGDVIEHYGPHLLLTGSGTISSPNIFLDETTLSPGDNPGDLASFVLDTPDFHLGLESSLEFDLDSLGHSDRLLFTGSFTVDPFPSTPDYDTLILHFLAPPTGQTYTLISASSFSGTFPTISGLPANYTLTYTPTSLLLTPIPEPASLTLLLLGGLLMLKRRHRRLTH